MGIFRQWPTNQWRRACRYHYKEATSYNNLRGGLSAYFYFSDYNAFYMFASFFCETADEISLVAFYLRNLQQNGRRENLQGKPRHPKLGAESIAPNEVPFVHYALQK